MAKKESTIKGVTSSGFKFEITKENLDDYELIEMISEMDDGNTKVIPSVIKKILGENQKNELVEFLRKDGRTSITDMANAFKEIMSAMSEGKKS